MNRGLGDLEGQIGDVGRFASRIRSVSPALRWGAYLLVALVVVPVIVGIVLGVAELFR